MSELGNRNNEGNWRFFLDIRLLFLTEAGLIGLFGALLVWL